MALLASASLVVGEAFAQCNPADPECPAWEFATTYTGEFWRNTHGGIDEGGAYLDNLDVTLALNGEKLIGVPGLTLFAYGIYNNGNELNGRYVGDAQGVSNIEAVNAIRLHELWAELNLGGDTFSVRTGQYDLNSEFDVIETAGLFMNSSHGIGTDIAQTGLNGPSIFPIAGLGARVRWRPTASTALQAVILDAVPGDPEEPDRTALDLGDGSLLVAEAHWYGDRIAKAAVGYWRYSPRFDDLVAVDENDEPLRRSDNDGLYAFVDAILLRESDEARGLRGWVRYGEANEHVNLFESYFGAGLVYTGALAGRSEDQLGIAVAHVHTGAPYRQAVALAGGRADTHEVNIELTYRFGVTDWLTLQPNLQYVRNPNTDPALDDALVVGLRFELGYSRSAE
jgi:porin